MVILVLGGTGAIGNYITKILSLSGNDVYVTSRAERNSVNGITFIKGDAHEIPFIKKICSQRKYDCIIDFMCYRTDEFRDRIKFILSATEQYFFLSSSRVYDYSDKAITEDSIRLLDSSVDQIYLQSDEYALAKARQENILSMSSFHNWTIIRPYITYSNIRLQLGLYEKERWLYRALRGKPILFSKDISKRSTSLTYGLDVAFIMSKMVGNVKTLGQAFNIVSPDSVLWENILEIYLDTIERKTGKRPIVHMCNTAIVPSGAEYQYKYDRMFDRIFDSARANIVIGERTNYTNVKDGLRKCLEEFIDQNREWKQIDWKTEAIFDRISGVRDNLLGISGKKNKIKYLVYRNIY